MTVGVLPSVLGWKWIVSSNIFMNVVNHITVSTASPIITLQPTSRTFKYNKRNALVFEIVATGVGQIEYLWQKYDPFTDSWIPVSSRAINDTSPTLNFSVITEEDQGMYHCIVTNYDGSVASDNVTVTVFGKLQLIVVVWNSKHAMPKCIRSNVHTSGSIWFIAMYITEVFLLLIKITKLWYLQLSINH